MGNTDSIPIISQVKSLIQVISGDVDGARKTQENFRDTAPVVSQVTSLVHTIGGNTKEAKRVQEKFLKNLDEISDGLPIVGHIKGSIHYANGDHERGERAMKDATGSLASMAAGAAGFVAGGPVGAVVASSAVSHAYDGLVTGIDTARKGLNEDGSPRYYGSLASYDRISKGKASAGEVFDTVGMQIIDAATGALGGKLGKGKFSRRPRFKGVRCRRDVEYHLTSDEATFVTSHRSLPGSASEVITARWQHLSPAETVSNLVSLFIILRLILWNDKHGRDYSKEICSMTENFDYVEKCQESLMKTLRQMEDHLNQQKGDFEYIINPPLTTTGISEKSTVLLIKMMASLYGILDSMARGDLLGLTWVAELCMFEDLAAYGLCEEEVLAKMKELGKEAFSLGEARKRRFKRGGGCKSPKTPTKKTIQRTKPRNPNVGIHRDVQAVNRVKNANQGSSGTKFESNHVPAKGAYPGKKTSGGSLPAHSLPYDIHQTAMTKVGTSKNSNVAKTLRNYESQLMQQGNMADAIKLDLTASYGRANAGLKGEMPALVKYKNDMLDLVDLHESQGRITKTEASNLRNFVNQETNAWNQNKNWDNWMDRMENNYENILKNNNLKTDPYVNVPPGDRDFG